MYSKRVLRDDFGCTVGGRVLSGILGHSGFDSVI